MKQILEETDDNGFTKRYYYDSKKTDSVIIIQLKISGKVEKMISEMRIPLEYAPDKIKDLVNE